LLDQRLRWAEGWLGLSRAEPAEAAG
jgi:hypothetical protein